VPTRNDTYVFVHAERPDAFVKMLLLLLGCGAGLAVWGWLDWRSARSASGRAGQERV
jgi:hypothetical protein